MNNPQQHDQLYKAFGLFIEAMRPYIVSVLMKEAGDKWPEWFVEVLSQDQKKFWEESLRAGSSPSTLIDYQHLMNFSLKYKDLLRKDFGPVANGLPTQFRTIVDARNKVSHFKPISPDEVADAMIQMKKIARGLGMDELETELSTLQEHKPAASLVAAPRVEGSTGVPPWFRVVQPHFDIRQGLLDESVFAANLAEVALGNGREIYKDPATFFSKTFFTAGLKTVAKTVIKGLNGQEDAENRVISLQTGFGGGKTHTLISLYHLAKWGKKAGQSDAAKRLLEYTGLPAFESANIAVFTNTTNDPANGRTTAEGLHIQTIWGELAYQLGGLKAYEIVRKNDEGLIAPGGSFRKVLEMCQPALILLDELADYCVKASARTAGNSSLADQTISFMQELTQAVSEVNQCVVVVTLPASVQEVGNTPEAQSILNQLQKRVSRVGADTQPVADEEIYEVIRCRLFEEVGDASIIEACAVKYMDWYQKHRTELPGNATKAEYKQKIIKAYPFHPELIDVFRVRWASHHDFQRTRGALRLLAAIVSDLWKRQQSLPGSNLLIHSGEVNFAHLDALSGQLKRLYGNGYDAVITADVAGSSSNAFKIDGNNPEYGQHYLTQSIAAVILMNSFGSDGANKGISVPELKLQLLVPDDFNHNNINGALDKLEAEAYYLYYAQTGAQGKRYWFHTKPNINILINQAKADIKPVDIEADILKRLQERTRNAAPFNILVNPSDDIPDQQKPTLIVLHPRYQANPDKINGQTRPIIERLATKKGNSERIYRNTMLFLVCSEMGYNRLESQTRENLACQKISLEYSSQLEREQKDEIRKRMEESAKQAEAALVAAYSLVMKHSVKNGISVLPLKQFQESLDRQISTHIVSALKEEEWLLESVGLNTLRNNNLLPTLTHALRTKDVYEAFLRFDDKPMILHQDAVSNSLLRYCQNGEFCIAAGDGTHFIKYFLGEMVPFFDVTDETYWLVDKSLKPPPQPVLPVETPTSLAGPSENPSVVLEPDQPGGGPRTLRFVQVSGKVPLDQYTQLFSSFIMPLAQNNIEIEIRIKGKTTVGKPITDNSPEYKVVKEAAKQLGLDFEEE